MTITKNVWKAAALLLILSLITAVMISGTYAKYTSTYAGQDTALVAKWDIVATGGGIGLTDGGMASLDLFSHEYDTHVKQMDGTDYIIAPGVAGDFTLEFDNNSDVDAEITVNIAKKAGSADVPIVYSFTSPAGVTTYDEAGLAVALKNAFGTIAADPAATTPPVQQTVYWFWTYEVDDAHNATDSALGVGSAGGTSRTTYGLTVTASAVQVIPTP